MYIDVAQKACEKQAIACSSRKRKNIKALEFVAKPGRPQ
jgi:hypothetical protein